MDRKMLKLYYRQIRNNLYCSKKRKKRLLDELKTNIEESLEEKPNLTYGELLEIYGTPKEIADSYIESLDPEEYAEDLIVVSNEYMSGSRTMYSKCKPAGILFQQ